MRQVTGLGLSSPTRIESRTGTSSREAWVLDAGNERVVVVRIPEESTGSGPATVWDAYRAALTAGDIEGSAAFYVERERASAIENLEQLGPALPQFVQSIGPLTAKEVGEFGAVYQYTHTAWQRAVNGVHPIWTAPPRYPVILSLGRRPRRRIISP